MGNFKSRRIQNVFNLIITYIGLKNKDYRVILFGLDSSGKTTLLYRLKLEKQVQTIPTIGFNVETIKHGQINLMVWDIGLRDRSRSLIRHYLENTHALIYVIDSNDRERLNEAKEELNSLSECDALKDTALLVLANKQDLKNVMTCDEIEKQLCIEGMKSFKNKNVFGIEAKTGKGCKDALDWLEQSLNFNETKKPWLETLEDIKQIYKLSLEYFGLITSKIKSYLDDQLEIKFKINTSENIV